MTTGATFVPFQLRAVTQSRYGLLLKRQALGSRLDAPSCIGSWSSAVHTAHRWPQRNVEQRIEEGIKPIAVIGVASREPTSAGLREALRPHILHLPRERARHELCQSGRFAWIGCARGDLDDPDSRAASINAFPGAVRQSASPRWASRPNYVS